ncbi:DUF962 domain-containing protein [Cognaticolwellia beringensis]|uniref:DUF962 domain-containing protein n=1 Tax=Cognaticolwellia beringensis TaxID=1967665 RepID=A0A222GAS1_9GAMM|nr:DUF962 domain-containing protein [Cognaticolwellia beringensis]ASP48802.1 DUF962 domain-containing protein [Cognaticolwellia beringensis]
MTNEPIKHYSDFKSFYPFYLSQHQNTICRRLHFIGSSLIVITLGYILMNAAWLLLWTLPLFGYGFAWLGHFFFEKNKPATFTYPWYSFLGDWVMYKDMLLGKLKF